MFGFKRTSHIENLYKQILDNHLHIRKIHLRFNQLPWINPNIQRDIRRRNRLYKKFRRFQSDSNWYCYKVQHNKVTKLKRKAIRDFCYEASLNTQNHSPGVFWKKLKSLLPNNKSEDMGIIHIIKDGNLINNPASTFNSFFTSPPINEYVLSVSESDFINHPRVVDIANQSYQLNFSFEPGTLEYVTELLLDLDEKKSCGPDGFPPKFLKLSAPAIASSLTKLFNYCIATSTGSFDW